MTGIQNIIFDMGNVLLEWNARKNIERLEANSERADQLEKVILKSGIWEKQDTGELSPEQAIDLVKSQLDSSYHAAVEGIFLDWYRHVEVYKDLQDYAIQLSQKGYRIYILSNTSAIYYEIERAGLLPITQVLSGKILSFEEQCMKPDVAIFQTCLERYQLLAERCVFIDDIEQNVQVARSLGMEAIQCQNSQQVIEELQVILDR